MTMRNENEKWQWEMTNDKRQCLSIFNPSESLAKKLLSQKYIHR